MCCRLPAMWLGSSRQMIYYIEVQRSHTHQELPVDPFIEHLWVQKRYNTNQFLQNHVQIHPILGHGTWYNHWYLAERFSFVYNVHFTWNRLVFPVIQNKLHLWMIGKGKFTWRINCANCKLCWGRAAPCTCTWQITVTHIIHNYWWYHTYEIIVDVITLWYDKYDIIPLW